MHDMPRISFASGGDAVSSSLIYYAPQRLTRYPFLVIMPPSPPPTPTPSTF